MRRGLAGKRRLARGHSCGKDLPGESIHSSYTGGHLERDQLPSYRRALRTHHLVAYEHLDATATLSNAIVALHPCMHVSHEDHTAPHN